MPLDVFISYHHDDLIVAKAVCDMLEAASMSCWFSKRDERPGEDWMEALVRGLDSSQIVVFILSANSNKSSACRKELALADEMGMPIIPLRIEDISPTGGVRYVLAGRHRLDALTPPIDRHLNALVDAARSLIESLPHEGAPPQSIKESVDKSKPDLLDLGTLTRSDEAQPYIERGFTLDNLGRYEEAVACYDKALEIDPYLAKAWFSKASSLSNLSLYEEAVACYDKALEIDPLDMRAWYNKGIDLDSLGRYEEAIACYDRALQITPDDEGTLVNKAGSLDESGRDEEAIACYDKALEIDPDDVIAWNNKGISLTKLGRYEEAIACYDKALEINPHLANAWNNKGNIFHNLGRYEEAIACYDKALEIDPNSKLARENKQISLRRLGEKMR